MFMSKNVTNKLFMKCDLFKLRTEEDGNLGEHIAQFNQKINDLLCMDVKLEYEEWEIMFIYSLPPSFNHLTTMLMFGKETLDYKEVVSKL